MTTFAVEHPRLLHGLARDLWRQGVTPWVYVQCQWGKLITADDYKQDREWWEEGHGGRWLILEGWQKDAIEAIADDYHTTIALKGNTGCGKNAITGIGAVAYYDVWDDAVITLTRDTATSAVKITFGEVRKWWMRSAVRPLGLLLNDKVKHTVRHYMNVANPLTDEGFSGEHTEHVMMLLDEATAVRASIHQMAHTQAHKVLKIGNPRTTAGPFRRTFPKRDADKDQTIMSDGGATRCITISGERCSNVRLQCLEKAIAPLGGISIKGRRFEHGAPIPPEYMKHAQPIIPGQVGYDRWMQLAANSDPNWAACMAYGRFPDENPEHQLIKTPWLIRTSEKHRRWLRAWNIATGKQGRQVWWDAGHRYSQAIIDRLDRMLPIKALGLDVNVGSSEDTDESVLAIGSMSGVRALHAARFARTSDLVRWVISTMEDQHDLTITTGAVPVGVDTGFAPGVADTLAERGVFVVRCGSTAARNPSRFGNKRSERFGTLADRLDPRGAFDYRTTPHARTDAGYDRILDGLSQVFALPDDELLDEELKSLEKVYKGGSRDKFWVTPKRGKEIVDYHEDPPRVIEPLTKALGRSPDRADAVSYMIDACDFVGVDLAQWMADSWGAEDADI